METGQPSDAVMQSRILDGNAMFRKKGQDAKSHSIRGFSSGASATALKDSLMSGMTISESLRQRYTLLRASETLQERLGLRDTGRRHLRGKNEKKNDTMSGTMNDTTKDTMSGTRGEQMVQIHVVGGNGRNDDERNESGKSDDGRNRGNGSEDGSDSLSRRVSLLLETPTCVDSITNGLPGGRPGMGGIEGVTAFSASGFSDAHTHFLEVTRQVHDYMEQHHPSKPVKKVVREDVPRIVEAEKTWRNLWGIVGSRTEERMVTIERTIEAEDRRTPEQSAAALRQLVDEWMKSATRYESMVVGMIREQVDPALARISQLKRTYRQEAHDARKDAYLQATSVEKTIALLDDIASVLGPLCETDDRRPLYESHIDDLSLKLWSFRESAAAKDTEAKKKAASTARFKAWERGMYHAKSVFSQQVIALREYARQVAYWQSALAPLETIMETAHKMQKLVESGSDDIIALSKYVNDVAGLVFGKLSTASLPYAPEAGSAVAEGVQQYERVISSQYERHRDHILTDYAPREQGSGGSPPKT